ncbi:MAG: MFS transporter [Bacteroidetes bacterium]|nr:MFS transporter [Bacteroidota bacterium]
MQHTGTTSKIAQPLLWGMVHGLNDFSAGFMLSYYALRHNPSQSFLLLIIYTIIGFGGQLPCGFWIDRAKNLRPFAHSSAAFLLAAIPLFYLQPEAGIIMSGFASALIHVTGGAVCFLSQPQEQKMKSTPLAIFTAPGVLGLTLGGLTGKLYPGLLWMALPIVLLLFVLISRERLPEFIQEPQKPAALDTHDYIMMGLLLVMCFRSFVFDVINQVALQYEFGVVIIGLSAFAGKIIGGLLADRIGYKKYVYISLPLALLLFQLGKDNLYALATGIAFLQSSVPITLLLMGRSLPLHPATASAFSLGASILLAGLPVYGLGNSATVINGFRNNYYSIAVMIVLMLAWIISERMMMRKKISGPV